MADSLPKVDACCFSCQLKPGTITIGILGFMFLSTEVSRAFHKSEFDNDLVRIALFFAAAFSIASLLLVIAAIIARELPDGEENTTLVLVYVYVALVYLIILVLLWAVRLWEGSSWVDLLITNVIQLALLFYFIVVANSFRLSI